MSIPEFQMSIERRLLLAEGVAVVRGGEATAQPGPKGDPVVRFEVVERLRWPAAWEGRECVLSTNLGLSAAVADLPRDVRSLVFLTGGSPFGVLTTARNAVVPLRDRVEDRLWHDEPNFEGAPDAYLAEVRGWLARFEDLETLIGWYESQRQAANVPPFFWGGVPELLEQILRGDDAGRVAAYAARVRASFELKSNERPVLWRYFARLGESAPLLDDLAAACAVAGDDGATHLQRRRALSELRELSELLLGLGLREPLEAALRRLRGSLTADLARRLPRLPPPAGA